MELTTRTLPARKHIALVAHDHCKQMLMSWVERHQPLLEQHVLYATGTTGNLISRATGMNVNAMLSGPMGGDQQVGALISEGKIDVLIFFWDDEKLQRRLASRLDRWVSLMRMHGGAQAEMIASAPEEIRDLFHDSVDPHEIISYQCNRQRKRAPAQKNVTIAAHY